ncbi:hypothetical protein BJB45_20560 [Halomonas huangheensis]|uniref:Uncharacterized protein n=1 Tax=Halomonas huangheensis TaxID=1178482 RepID=W1N639_9GAMM|nr:hypothetical protein BJB45_20560 [Halomonas huangheensis]
MIHCRIYAEMLMNVGEIAGMIGMLIGKHSRESKPENCRSSGHYEKISGWNGADASAAHKKARLLAVAGLN